MLFRVDNLNIDPLIVASMASCKLSSASISNPHSFPLTKKTSKLSATSSDLKFSIFFISVVTSLDPFILSFF